MLRQPVDQYDVCSIESFGTAGMNAPQRAHLA